MNLASSSLAFFPLSAISYSLRPNFSCAELYIPFFNFQAVQFLPACYMYTLFPILTESCILCGNKMMYMYISMP